MRKLTLTKKTGFRNIDPYIPVNIRDFRGLLFYSTESILPVEKFNLPAGEYFIDSGNFKPMKKPVFFKLNKMPKPERYLKPPFDFRITFEPNPNKCTIYWLLKKIVFDPALKEKTIPEIWFILFHEYAHSLYKSEHLADLMSANLMKVRGFNPSQIGSAPITALSSQQWERKKFLVDSLINSR